MKIRKTAEQKNFMLNTDFYTEKDLQIMLAKGTVTDLNKVLHREAEEPHLVVFTDNCKEVKVVYNKDYEFYETVAITNEGEALHVNI